MKFHVLIFSIFLFFNSNITFGDSVYFETFSKDDSSYEAGGWFLHDNAYIGVRFSVDDPIHISKMFGNIKGTGTFFSGITSLGFTNDFPKPTPGFDPSLLLAYSEITIDDSGLLSSDHLFSTNVNLDKGNYFLFFGSVNEDSLGFMPGSRDLSKSNIPLNDYLEYSLFPLTPNVDGWFEFENSGVRAGLVTVPLPASLLLFIFGISALVYKAKK